MLHTQLSLITFQDGTSTSVAPPTNTTQQPALGGAPAEGTAQNEPSAMTWLPFVLIFAVVWFMMINPERKNRKKREAMLGQLKKGDKVLTAAGLYGSVVQIQDQIVTLQIADGVRVRMNRGSIQQLEEDEAPVEKAKA